MEALKIVITGSYAAGKGRFIRTISDAGSVATDQVVTRDAQRQLKLATPVALEFGAIAAGDGLALHLFSLPAQERFDLMWDYVSIRCLGYVVLVDSTRPAHLGEAQRLMARLADLTDIPYVVAANKQDDETALPICYIRRRLGVPAEVPVLPCVATERASVKSVLLGLLYQVADRLAASRA